MSHNDDIKSLDKKIDKLSIDVAVIKTHLSNHLKHHTSNERWLQWGLPLGISIILLIKEFI